MPSTTIKQAKLMRAVCKSPEFRKKVDIPKKVACKFYLHDKKTGIEHKNEDEHNDNSKKE